MDINLEIVSFLFEIEYLLKHAKSVEKPFSKISFNND